MLDMNNYLRHLIAPAGIVGTLTVVWILMTVGFRYWTRRKETTAPMDNTEVSCRAQDCLFQLKVTNDYLKCYKAGLIVLPVLIAAAYLAVRHFEGAVGGMIEILGLVVFGLMLMLFVAIRVTRISRARNLMRLFHESRLATRRVLDPMLKDNYHVFHDVISDQFSVDHLVVGPKGVFAIQTHAKPASASKQNPDERIVTYNGRELFFPKGSDHGMVENARLNAEKLSEWLTGQTQEPIAVRAIISLPGWTVRRTSSEGIPVINPKQFASLFEHIQPWLLPPETIESIHRRFEQTVPKSD